VHKGVVCPQSGYWLQQSSPALRWRPWVTAWPGCCHTPLCCPADWALVDAACHAYSMIPVPLYDTLGPDTVEYISNHAELAAIACSIDLLDTLLQCLPKCHTVKLVVRPWACSHLPPAVGTPHSTESHVDSMALFASPFVKLSCHASLCVAAC
jgi:hypothetical protein